MSQIKFDIIVIGSGPGGEGAAMGLVKQRKKVAVIERYNKIGGGCTHWGTIPSKSLRHIVSRIIEFNKNPLYSDKSKFLCFSICEILKQAETVINQQTHMRERFYKRNNCNMFTGEASFINEHTLKILYNDSTYDILYANKIIIATGSHPYCPADVNFEHSRIYNSDSILKLNHKPRHLIIYGAGVIGCEYASIFRGLGIKVDLINTRNHLLSFLDQEMSDSLSYHFCQNGVVIRHNEEYEKIEGTDDGVIIHLKSGKKVKGDCLLYANGRTGNSNNLNLKNIDILVDNRGLIKVDSNYRTKNKNIYAIGDIIGYPSLASAAHDQGRLVALAILNDSHRDKYLTQNIPTGIYTIPEISSVGKTEQELTAMKIPYEVGRAQFKYLARAQITGINTGSLKILFHRETLKVLGIHCFGEHATEIIHIGQAIMEQKGKANTIEYFVNTTFNYPTMAEAFRVAALNGLNRLF
ncbi:MAG: Si-specific NAD(P)(+) transhydrogenase [Arsenophonus sp. ET-KM2-MAG3]